MAESDPISAAWAQTQAAGGDTEYASQGHDPRAPTPLLGRGAVVGRYLILGQLGEGGMGVVYTAHDPELDRKVALKLMRGEGAKASSSGAPVRLLREAQALARLAHPNVVAIHDVGALGDDVWLAMEHIDGQTLSTWLKEQPRTWRQIVAVFRQAGEGLAAAHAAGLVHRDFLEAQTWPKLSARL
jgi:serine/threonine protein kinase